MTYHHTPRTARLTYQAYPAYFPLQFGQLITRALPAAEVTRGSPLVDLDTFLTSGSASLALVAPARSHAAGQWHTAALVYAGREMSHYVDGRREASGLVSFAPLGSGRTALGVRLNSGVVVQRAIAPRARDA